MTNKFILRLSRSGTSFACTLYFTYNLPAMRAERIKGEVSFAPREWGASSPLFRVLCLLSWRNKKVRSTSGICWRISRASARNGMSFFAEAQKDKGETAKAWRVSKGTEHKFPLGTLPCVSAKRNELLRWSSEIQWGNWRISEYQLTKAYFRCIITIEKGKTSNGYAKGFML